MCVRLPEVGRVINFFGVTISGPDRQKKIAVKRAAGSGRYIAPLTQKARRHQPRGKESERHCCDLRGDMEKCRFCVRADRRGEDRRYTGHMKKTRGQTELS